MVSSFQIKTMMKDKTREEDNEKLAGLHTMLILLPNSQFHFTDKLCMVTLIFTNKLCMVKTTLTWFPPFYANRRWEMLYWKLWVPQYQLVKCSLLCVLEKVAMFAVQSFLYFIVFFVSKHILCSSKEKKKKHILCLGASTTRFLLSKLETEF